LIMHVCSGFHSASIDGGHAATIVTPPESSMSPPPCTGNAAAAGEAQRSKEAATHVAKIGAPCKRAASEQEWRAPQGHARAESRQDQGDRRWRSWPRSERPHRCLRVAAFTGQPRSAFALPRRKPAEAARQPLLYEVAAAYTLTCPRNAEEQAAHEDAAKRGTFAARAEYRGE